jgi:hypothetical protein
VLRAFLLVYHRWKSYGQVFGSQGWWAGSMPGSLGSRFCQSLNDTLPNREGPRYVFEGLDAVVKTPENDPGVNRFLAKL